MSKFKVIGVVLATALLIGSIVLLGQMSSSDKTANDTSSSEMNDSSTDTSSNESSTPVATNSVEIKDHAFSPGNITVKKGTTVTWTNQDDVQHDVMSDKTDVAGPSSELLSKGQSYSYTFDAVGTYTYHCTPHSYMKGTVTVTE